jgi:TRAP-type C4-dicarboxylate transport system permease small subunit
VLHVSGAVVAVERVVSRAMMVLTCGHHHSRCRMRYLAGRPIIFAEELAAIMLVWLAFIAISISLHTARKSVSDARRHDATPRATGR